MSAPKKCSCGGSVSYQYEKDGFYEGNCVKCNMRFANPKPSKKEVLIDGMSRSELQDAKDAGTRDQIFRAIDSLKRRY